MMPRVGVLVAILLVVSCMAAAEEPIEIMAPQPYLTKQVSEWSVSDVAAWMNTTIGYSEYAGFVEKHRVDGPTLLYLTQADFEEFFPISNGIHIVKLRAHLDVLRGKCLCGTTVEDFWSYLESNRDSAYTRGSAILYMPRVALFYTYFFDSETMSAALGSATEDGLEVSAMSNIIFFLGSLLFPNLYVALQCLRFWLSNYFVITTVVVYLLMCQYNELVHAYNAYKGLRRGEVTAKAVAKKLCYHFTMAIPVGVYILSFVLPYAMMQILVVAFLAHSLFLTVGTVAMIVNYFMPPKEGANQQQQQ